jgi:ribosomal protein S3AE
MGNFVLQKVKDQTYVSSVQRRWSTLMMGITDIQTKKQLHCLIRLTAVYFTKEYIIFKHVLCF